MYVYLKKKTTKGDGNCNLGQTHCKGRVEVEDNSYIILKKTFLLSKTVKQLDNIKTKLLHSFKLCHFKTF